MHKKLGGIPVPVLVGTILGGLLLGVYLRHRAKANANASSSTTSAPAAGVSGYSTGAGGSGADSTDPGLSGGLLALLTANQNQLQSLINGLLTNTGGGGGSVPAATPATATADTPSSGGSGASPNSTSTPAPLDPTFTTPAPLPPYQTPPAPDNQTLYVSSGGVDLGTITAPQLPLSAPAADYYFNIGAKPSDPITILPSPSSGPSAQLADTIKIPPRAGGAIAV